MSLITYSIPNWDQYNPRSDRPNLTWFRMESSFFDSQNVFGLRPSAVVLLLFLRCARNRKGEQSVDLLTEFIADRLKISETEIINDLQILSERTLIELSGGGIINPSGKPKDTAGCPTVRTVRDVTGRTGPDTAVSDNAQLVLVPEPEKPNTASKGKEELPRIAVLWNKHAGPEFSRVTRCSAKRRKKIETAWKRDPQDSFWVKLFEKVNASPFLSGKVPGKDFLADFDFVIQDEIVDKIADGKYDERGTASQPKRPSFMAEQVEGKTQ